MEENPGQDRTSKTVPTARDVVRAYLDVLALGEPLLHQLWHASGTSLSQFRVLRLLSQRSQTAGSLAEDAGLPKSSISRILERLEQRGFIVREWDQADRRRVRIRLTAQGEEALRNWPAEALEDLTAAAEAMSPEERQTFLEASRSFARRVRGLEEHAANPPTAARRHALHDAAASHAHDAARTQPGEG